MATLEENIETLSQRMIQDANAEAEKDLVAARRRAEEILRGGQVQAEAECKAILDRAQEEKERLRSQTVATTQLKARNEQLAFREKLLDDVFQATREKLSELQRWNNYDEIALSLLKEALAHLAGYPVRIRIDPAMKKLISEERMRQVAEEMNMEVIGFSELSQGTGVIVETEDGHLNYDNMLETRLARMQNTLRAPVYHVLTGEQV